MEANTSTAAVHKVTWQNGSPTFTCTGDATSSCHIFPDCECELWSNEHDFEHQPGPHDTECWVLEWLKATGVDGYDESELPAGMPTVPHIDSEIDWEWDYDCVIWRYPEGVSA